MIAVRKDLVEEFECVAWKKTIDGNYKAKNGNQTNAYTRMMVCKITLDGSVGHFGKTQCVMNVHLHCRTANEMFGTNAL